MSATPEIIERIRKLLVLSEDDGATPGEAALAAERVQQLLFKYNLERAQIRIEDETVAPSVVLARVETGVAETDWRHILLFELAASNFCHGAQAIGTGNVEIIGSPDDVTVVNELYNFLFEELTHQAASRYDRPKVEPMTGSVTGSAGGVSWTLTATNLYLGMMHGPKAKEQFLLGAVTMIARRLRENLRTLRAESSASTALVTTKEQDVGKAVETRYKNRVVQENLDDSVVKDVVAFSEGQYAGSRVSLTPKRRQIDGAGGQLEGATDP